jgi:lipoprotein-anchoring transpeptidase ErfK/SrfK
MNAIIDPLPESNQPNKLYRFVLILITLLFSVGLVTVCFLKSENLKEVAMGFYSFPSHINSFAEKDSTQLSRMLIATQKRVNDHNRKIDNLAPSQPYLIVNTTTNTFILRTRNIIIREGLCSTGSYTLLDAGEDLQWIFKTPKGMFRIQSKLKNPLWVKPDWAFIEEGLTVPPKNHPDRFEYGTLGDYALSLGQGYLIHGTLYQRFLGLPVTHGCIRLGDEDLKEVFNKLNEGSRVYIF